MSHEGYTQHGNHHYSNEMPPDFDETDRANKCRSDCEHQVGHPFNDWEVTNIRHVLHVHNATEINYLCRALCGDGHWLLIDFKWFKADNSV